MTYIRSYIESLFEIGKVLGLIFLAISLYMDVSGAQFFAYLTVMAAFAGPISVGLHGGKE